MQESYYKWTDRFMEIAGMVATWSKDPNTKVGAVIADDTNRVAGLGYNGFPRGLDDSPEVYRDLERKHKRVVHAEANAIMNSTIRPGQGYTMFTTLSPCPHCAALIIQAEWIFGVVFADLHPAVDNQEALGMLREAGIGVYRKNKGLQYEQITRLAAF